MPYQNSRGFSPAGYVPTAGHDPNARPTPPPRAYEQPPIVFESIRGLQIPSVTNADVVFRQASPRHHYLSEARQDEAFSRSTLEDSPVVQALAGPEEEPASRSRTDGPVVQFLVNSKKVAHI